ncbi:hypothetical protein FHY55_13190 [Oceanicola sp. D3]|uniref:hypothetical protein n=1 Tax=Oceanicola sp. D3 TaxID=2587163 RepID=UPI00111E8BCC|nr:hypothetical protein [Oceanicola sp. D3]QDC10143.1 hypothetical protein FHY55_13190 [Oceanicola sp. D3]
MALTVALIKARLASASFMESDDEARSLVTSASTADLAGLEAEGALRLYNALAGGYRSAEDQHAITLLLTFTPFSPPVSPPDEAVAAVRAAVPTSQANQTHLKGDMVTRLYAAEKSRLSLLERAGIDGETIGRGQLGGTAFADVTKEFAAAWVAWVEKVAVGKRLKKGLVTLGAKFDPNCHTVKPRDTYGWVINDKDLEDFVVSAYLALCIKRSEKPGRTALDAVRFGVARYHGALPSMIKAQAGMSNPDKLLWTKVAAALPALGKADVVTYVGEVVK